jgi:hypothetical protein
MHVNRTQDRTKLDRQLIDAVRELLGMAPLYFGNGRIDNLDRFHQPAYDFRPVQVSRLRTE